MNIKEVILKQDLAQQVAYLRKQNAALERKIEQMNRRTGEVQLLARTVKESIAALEPLPPIAYQIPRKLQSSAEIAAVVKFSDWHIGERVRREETENLNEFNYTIAQERVREITGKIVGWTATHRMAFKISRLYVFCEQDFISGDIHDELRRTNEFPVPVQAVKAGSILAQSVATLAAHFDEVVLVEVGGDNHSRLTQKPQAKQKSINSFGYVVYAILNTLVEKHKNIRIESSEAMTLLVDVVGQKFLCEHGDTVRGWMGTPYYGLARHKGREAVRRMIVRKQQDIGFDYISCGHFHVPAIIEENILVNGALNGTTEYDHACGRHAKPAQVSFMCHRKYGIFDWTAWHTKR